MINRRRFLTAGSNILLGLYAIHWPSSFAGNPIKSDKNPLLLVSSEALSADFNQGFEREFGRKVPTINSHELIKISASLEHTHIAGLVSWSDWELLNIIIPNKKIILQKQHIPSTTQDTSSQKKPHNDALAVGSIAARNLSITLENIDHSNFSDISHNTPYVSFVYSL